MANEGDETSAGGTRAPAHAPRTSCVLPAPRSPSSPTFAIVASYRGRLPVHHADLYRLADEDELHATGFGELVGGEGALLVEWADRIPGALPAERLTLRLAHDPVRPSVRHVEIDGVGARHAALGRALVAPAR